MDASCVSSAFPARADPDIIVTGTCSTEYVHNVTIATAAALEWLFLSQRQLMLNEQPCQPLGLLVSLLMRPALLPPPGEGAPYSPHLAEEQTSPALTEGQQRWIWGLEPGFQALQPTRESSYLMQSW